MTEIRIEPGAYFFDGTLGNALKFAKRLRGKTRTKYLKALKRSDSPKGKK